MSWRCHAPEPLDRLDSSCAALPCSCIPAETILQEIKDKGKISDMYIIKEKVRPLPPGERERAVRERGGEGDSTCIRWGCTRQESARHHRAT